jgi:hypothetical protein
MRCSGRLLVNIGQANLSPTWPHRREGNGRAGLTVYKKGWATFPSRGSARARSYVRSFAAGEINSLRPRAPRTMACRCSPVCYLTRLTLLENWTSIHAEG